ncbi:hypothetical protein [Glutamicibacter sp.]|uniref:hypothetical protein n=1 Tax=Glutamicibacter sp. TaxID=1931995 RepID=UPI002B49B3BA|nr:hypothetical protein [Glutamicibacter sp.]HJX78734.1 hypothetical protein [Glutamicibacter sp.]
MKAPKVANYRTASPWWAKLLGVVTFAVVIGSYIQPMLGGSMQPIFIAFVVLGAYVCIGVIISFSFIGMKDGHISLGLFPFGMRRLSYTEISSVEYVEHVDTSDYLGGGWKRGQDRSSVILWKSGPALKIKLTSGKRYIIQSDGAEMLVEATKKKIATSGS